jgi:hypothetical protein
MFSCDYNGWADMREEEREAIDVFETTEAAAIRAVLVFTMEAPVMQVARLELQAA